MSDLRSLLPILTLSITPPEVMGTRGLFVFCYNGWYWFEYHHHDSYPEGGGVTFAGQVPRDPVLFKKWLKHKKRELQADLDEQGLDDTKPEGFRPDGDDENWDNWVQRGPSTNMDHAWIYTIDLDDLLFHANDQPLFHLDHMPPDEFVSSIGSDAYGRVAPSESLPKEFRVALSCTDLPLPTKEDIDFYFQYATKPHIQPIHELLRVAEVARGREDVRETFLSAGVGQYLASRGAQSTTLWLGMYGRRKQVPVEVITATHELISLALSHRLIAMDAKKVVKIDHPLHPNWFRIDMFSYFATQLQNEDHLRSIIAQVVRLIAESSKRGVVFGVICSLLHVVILRISIQPDSVTFAHTNVMQFCPEQYAKSPRTPGIAALSRLSALADPGFMIQDPANLEAHPGLFSDPVYQQRYPSEIWIAIAQHLFQTCDLVALGCTSRQCQFAVAEILRDLAFPGLRIVSCFKTDWNKPAPPPPTLQERFDRERNWWSGRPMEEQPEFVHPRLHHASFTALDESGRTREVHMTTWNSLDIVEKDMEYHGFLVEGRDPQAHSLLAVVGEEAPCYFYNDIYQ